LGKHEFPSSIKHRARQNVILEFGYFIGLLGRDKVCCLYKGDVELPSDMRGIVYIPFSKSVNRVREKIIKELQSAGYELLTKKRKKPRKKPLNLKVSPKLLQKLEKRMEATNIALGLKEKERK